MFKIDEELAQVIANYLSTKPYSEVAEILSRLTKIEKIEEEK